MMIVNFIRLQSKYIATALKMFTCSALTVLLVHHATPHYTSDLLSYFNPYSTIATVDTEHDDLSGSMYSQIYPHFQVINHRDSPVSDAYLNDIVAAINLNPHVSIGPSFSKYLPTNIGMQGPDYVDIKEVVVVDSDVQDLPILINNITRTATIEFIDRGSDGVSQLAEIVSQYDQLNALHVISHGAPAQLMLGNTLLGLNNINTYQNELTQLGSAMSATGDVMFYGCNAAKGELGKGFINELRAYTKADIAASIDVTGADDLGYNSTLEDANNIESTNLFSFYSDRKSVV